MKNNIQEFHAVEFMHSIRKRLTVQYQQNRTAFLKELDRTTQEFLTARKKKKSNSKKIA